MLNPSLTAVINQIKENRPGLLLAPKPYRISYGPR